MSKRWTGETYFDLQGRDPGELKVAVAAARRGKPIRDKGQAKKEVKSNRFVTIGDPKEPEGRLRDKARQPCYV